MAWLAGLCWLEATKHPTVFAAPPPWDRDAEPIPTARDADILFCSVGELIVDLRKAHQDRHTMERARRCELLLLDDVGATSEMSWMTDEITNMLEERYSSERPTCYTSNKTGRALAEEPGWARMADRMRECCIPLLYGGDSLRKAPEVE